MKKKIIILVAIIAIIGLAFGSYFLFKNIRYKNDLKTEYKEIKTSLENYVISESDKSILEEKVDEIKAYFDNEEYNDKVKEALRDLKEEFGIKREENLKILEELEKNISGLNREKFSKEQEDEYKKLFSSYKTLKENEQYIKAEEKLQEIKTFVESAIKEIKKASQPDVLTDAIKTSNMSYRWNSNEPWILILNGTLKNTTDYDFGKVVITYDVIAIENYDGSERKQDCGDVIITVKDVKAKETRNYSYNKAATTITCQMEYDRIALKNIKAYK